MKLRNKKTGKIEIVCPIYLQSQGEYNSLAKLNEEWEDYKEPKEFYVVDFDGEILPSDFEDKTIEKSKELGKYFETKEEAEKAVEKLKAWKRLKDTLTHIDRTSFDDVGTATLFIRYDKEHHKKVQDELDLLFGGEE